MLWIAAGLILALFSSGPATASDATGRCSVQNCVCEVIPEAVPERHSRIAPKNQVLEDRVILYFNEDQSELDATDLADLRRFLDRNRGASWFQVTGHADVCGSAEYNLQLAENRARAAAAVVGSRLPGVRLSVSSQGESGATAHHEYFRKVEVLTSRAVTSASHGPGWLSARLDECRAAGADFYLIDASGSMQPYWPDVLSFQFPARSRVRLSIMHGCRNGDSLPAVSPGAGTEIWYSYWKVIDEMRAGQTLCIVPDFQSNIPLSGSERAAIEAKVRSTGIHVKSVRY